MGVPHLVRTDFGVRGSWLRVTAVERRSLDSELSLSYERHVSDG